MKQIRLIVAAFAVAFAAACSNSPTAPSATPEAPSFNGFAGSNG